MMMDTFDEDERDEQRLMIDEMRVSTGESSNNASNIGICGLLTGSHKYTGGRVIDEEKFEQNSSFNSANNSNENHPSEPKQNILVYSNEDKPRKSSEIRVFLKKSLNMSDGNNMDKEEGEIDDDEECAKITNSRVTWSLCSKKTKSSSDRADEHAKVISPLKNDSKGLAQNNTSKQISPTKNADAHLPLSSLGQTWSQQSPAAKRSKLDDNSEPHANQSCGDHEANQERGGGGGLSNDNDKSRKRKCRKVGGEASSSSPNNEEHTSSLLNSRINLEYETNKKNKHHQKDKSTNVCVKAIQVDEEDLDVRIGGEYTIKITVLNKDLNSIFFSSDWNGEELHGLLSNGMSTLRQIYLNKKSKLRSVVDNNKTEKDSTVNTQEQSSISSTKKAKRMNRSSSVCSVANNDGKSYKKPSTTVRPTSASTNEITALDQQMEKIDEQPECSEWSKGGDKSVNDEKLKMKCASSLELVANGLAELHEIETPWSHRCPVAGCYYSFDSQFDFVEHYHTHFSENRRAVFKENIATQTNVLNKDAGIDPVPELNTSATNTVKTCDFQRLEEKNETNCVGSLAETSGFAAQLVLSSRLSNSEQESINELFQVVNKDGTEKWENVGRLNQQLDQLKTCAGIEDKVEKLVQNTANTALEAMQKMVFDDRLQKADRPFVTVQTHNLPQNIPESSRITGIDSCTKSDRVPTNSPAYSDISDDAPTLEKEVLDKNDDNSLDKMKALLTTRSKTPLSVSTSDVSKTIAPHQQLPSVSLSTELNAAPHLSSSIPVSCHLSRPSTSEKILSNEVPHEAPKRNEAKIEIQPIPPVIPFGDMAPFIVDSSALNFQPVLGGPPLALSSNNVSSASPMLNSYFPILYGPSNIMNFGMNSIVNPSVLPPISSSNAPSKHKIHDLKVTAANSVFVSKDGPTMGLSSLSSPNARSHSVGPSNGSSTNSIPLAGTSKGGLSVTSSLHQNQPNAQNISVNIPKTKVSCGYTASPSQPHLAPGNMNVPSSQSLNMMQHQYLAHLQQQQQQMQIMQSQMRFGFPIMNSSAPMNPINYPFDQFAYMQAAASMGAFPQQNFQPK